MIRTEYYMDQIVFHWIYRSMMGICWNLKLSSRLGVWGMCVSLFLKRRSELRCAHTGNSIHGGSPKWWVYHGKSQSKMDDLGIPPFQETSIQMALGELSPLRVDHVKYTSEVLLLVTHFHLYLSTYPMLTGCSQTRLRHYSRKKNGV